MKRIFLTAALLGLTVPAAFSQGLIPLICGSPGTGSVSKTGTIFTFQGKKDDVMQVRLIGTQANQITSITVQDSAGTTRQQSFTSAVFLYTVPSEGEYRITVTGQGTGTFQVTYIPIKGSCGAVATLVCASPKKGSLGIGQLQEYQFNGKAGDTVFLRVLPIREGSDPNASLTLLAFDANQQQMSVTPNGTFKLTTDGIVSLVIGESSGLLKLNYAVTMINLNGSCTATSGNCGMVVDGSVADVLSANLYTVAASKGDVYQLKYVSTDDSSTLQPFIQVYDTQGTVVQPSATEASRVLYTMPADGTFTFLVQDSNGSGTGKYTLSLARLNRPCTTPGPGTSSAQPLSCGTPTAGQLNGPLRTVGYTVDAQAGDVYSLRLLRGANGTSFTPKVEVYGPGSGLQVQSVRTSDLGSVTFNAPVAGTYNLIAFDDSDGKQSGSFTIWSARLNRPCDGSVGLGCGFLAPGSISQALQTGMYSYPTAAGDSFTVRLVDTAGSLQTGLQVYDPRGNPVPVVPGATKAVDVTNSPGGAYTVLVTDQSRTPQQGTFQLEAFNTRGGCGTNPAQGQSVSGLISGAAPFSAYVFPASAGDMLLLRSAAFTPGFTANVDLYDPNGRRMGSGTTAVGPSRLTAGGSYTAIVGASAARGAGSYAFAWQLLNNPVATALQCGQTASGSLGSASQFWYYSVAANNNDLLKFLLTRFPGTLNAQVELFDPSGARQGTASTGDVVRKVTTGGNYLVLVSPASAAAENGAFGLALQRPNNPCSAAALACGQTILQQAPVAGQLDAFTFSANGADQLSITVTPRQGNYSPVTELYDQASATNLTVPSQGGGTTLTATLANTSQYTLTVHDRAGNTGSYRVALQRTNNACPENDGEKPVITLRRPTGGDVIAGGSAFPILWQSDDNIAVASHSIRLSTDGGRTFQPVAGATSLSGVAQSFSWVVPADIAASRTAVIQVTATDKAGNAQSASSDLLTVIGSGFTPNAQVTYQYDPLGRVTQATYQDGRVVSYTYDAAGNLATVTVK
jgi:YD repeat-containing protein